MKKKRIIIIIAVILVIAAIVFLLFRGGKKELVIKTEPAQETTIENIVTATGYVQPVDKVDIGTQVSGVIEKIYVDFNSQVKKGQLLAELDKSTLQERLSQSNASYYSAQSDLLYAQQNFDRIKTLYDSKAATQANYEEATNRLAQAKNALENAKANVHQAKVNLSYAQIYAPIDGIILNRAVEQGQTVAASFNTPTLFTIANDLKKMQVEADIDEADIGGVLLGQTVSFTVDSYTDDVFSGTVSQIRLQPKVTNNVVTYTVIIEAPNPDEKLFPGMTANISIVTTTETGIAIPAEALHFTPSEEIAKHFHLPAVTAKDNHPTQHSNGLQPDSTTNMRKVWIKTAESMRMQAVEIGLSDGINTIITKGLNPNDMVVLSAAFEVVKKDEKAVKNPLVPQRPGRKR